MNREGVIMKRLRVYLSSTFEDLKEYRAAVFAALEKGGLDVARMEAYTAADERPLDLCLRDVAQSEIYVGLFAWRYGYEPPADHGNPLAQSITDLEYRRAEAAKLRKLLFFAHPDTKAGWPERFKDEVTGDGERGEKLNRFRKEVGTEKTGSFFRTPDELATLVLASIMRSGLSGRLYNVPSGASGFVPRPKLTKSIVDALVGDGDGTPGASTLVQGPGGFGKTTLAIDVCHRAEVLDAFPDGLLWVTLGEEPDLAAKLSDLHVLATGNPPSVAGVEQVGQALAKALADRRCLVVVDDAWRPQDLAPFLNLEGPRLLVTTRIRSLIEQAGHAHWPDVPVDEMEPAEGAAILARGLAPDAANMQKLQRLADQLGCWPLLLELASARLLEENKARPDQLVDCIARVTLLFERKGVLGFDRRDANARNAAVASSVDVGLEKAEETVGGLARKAAELSVFPEDVAIPVQALADLWAMDAFDVEEDALRPLDDLSLVRWDRRTGEVRLHDMIRRAFEARLGEAKPVHRRLVNAWNDPHHLPHEYAWRWFGWHCVRADEGPRLQQLLLDFDWLRAKLHATEITALIGDFGLVQRSPKAELLMGALGLSAHLLGKHKGQLAAQLLARIPEREGELREGILKAALTDREPWLRPLRPNLTGPGGPLLRTLEGHSGHVRAVAILADGQRAVSASDDKTLKLWNLERGEVLSTFEGHWLAVAAVAITPDGQRAVSASWDRTLKVWDLETGVPLRTLEGHDSAVLAVAITPDGRRAVSASRDETLRVWDLWSGEVLNTLRGHGDTVTAVALTPNGQRVVSASADKTVIIWDLDTAMPLGKLVHEDAVTALAICPDGLRAAAATSACTKIWDIERFEMLQSFERQPGEALAIAPDGKHAVSRASGDTLEVWELDSGQVRHTLDGHGSPITAVAITPDGSRAISASWDHTLKIWDLERAQEARLDESHALGVAGLVPWPGSERVISVGIGGPRILDVARGECLGQLGGLSSRALAFAQNGRRLASASYAEAFQVWDILPPEAAAATVSPVGAPLADPFAPFDDPADPFADPFKVLPGHDESPAVSGRQDTPALHEATVRNPSGGLWGRMREAAASKLGWFAASASGPQSSPALAPDALTVEPVALHPHSAASNLFAERGKPQATSLSAVGLATPETPDRTPAPSAGVFAGVEGLAAVDTTEIHPLFEFDLELDSSSLDTPDGQFVERHRLHGHTGHVYAVAITPDGLRAVSASHDKTLKVWDAELGAELHTLTGHGGPVDAVAITPDGARAVSASWDHTLKVWNLAQGTLLCTLEGHTDWVLSVVVTPDGQHAVSASSDQTIKIWDLESGTVLRTIEGHTHKVNALALTAEGKGAVSGGEDRTVAVWDLTNGNLVARFVADSPINAVTIAHDGRSVVAGDSAGRLHFLVLENAPAVDSLV
jgi:WD40 repeat protein